MKPKVSCFIIVLFAIARSTASAQTTLMVPSQYPTIQAAINASATGDTVLVAPGTYVETIDYLGKEIVVRSLAGAAATVIDGNQQGSVVSFVSGEGPSSVIQGFTITNGSGYPDCLGRHGGGIHCMDTSPVIADCVVVGNVAMGPGCFGIDRSAGGGIACRISPIQPPPMTPPSPRIIRCEITNNFAFNGGGIGVQGVAPLIKDCDITLNTGANGGGIALFASSAIVESCVVHSNDSVVGGGVFAEDSAVTISGSLIESNTAQQFGGGIHIDSSLLGIGGAIILNSTIAKNSVSVLPTMVAPSGGGILIAMNLPASANPVEAMLRNVIVWDNSPDAVLISGGANPIFSHCDIAGGWTGAGSGNIDADPLFVDPAGGDFHLSAGSPCIDAGDATVAGLPARDIDGDLRVLYGSVDIGYDEWLAPCFSGTTGNPSAPEEIVTINGSSGPFVFATPGELLTLAVGQPSTNGNPADFALWLAPGVPPPPGLTLPWGTLCLTPTGQVLATSLAGLPAAIPATPTPWSRSTSGIPFPLTVTVQGLVVDDDTVTNRIAVTNGVVLVVE